MFVRHHLLMKAWHEAFAIAPCMQKMSSVTSKTMPSLLCVHIKCSLIATPRTTEITVTEYSICCICQKRTKEKCIAWPRLYIDHCEAPLHLSAMNWFSMPLAPALLYADLQASSCVQLQLHTITAYVVLWWTPQAWHTNCCHARTVQPVGQQLWWLYKIVVHNTDDVDIHVKHAYLAKRALACCVQQWKGLAGDNPNVTLGTHLSMQQKDFGTLRTKAAYQGQNA